MVLRGRSETARSAAFRAEVRREERAVRTGPSADSEALPAAEVRREVPVHAAAAQAVLPEGDLITRKNLRFFRVILWLKIIVFCRNSFHSKDEYGIMNPERDAQCAFQDSDL